MSLTGTIVDAFLAVVDTAIPGGVTTFKDFKDVEDLRREDLPHCQVFQTDRQAVGDGGLFRQLEENIILSCLYTDLSRNQEALRIRVDLIRVGIAADPTLGLATFGVKWTEVISESVTGIPQNDKGFNSTLFQVKVEVIT